MSNKLMPVLDAKDNLVGYAFYCPGCGCYHEVKTEPYRLEGYPVGPIWEFNGDLEHPTFVPSILVRWSHADGENCCHSYVKEGKIEFLSDCTHSMAGQTVELSEAVEE